ncbi:uncharacterized protein MELLADRAFT_113982 [Melampsora larici-populina 98AG31]|uniref:Uncharacterized protein n=1 Tax=Melampsora larici-populina (strain 98AG31 / pathotype 3-4-7) TaxID=747676 RepID=F4SBR1_MELLP|nr:uncharacterized protein MELLADRAFT_113982 [Melampsora larici-populina 98AG31]EGF97923.1 hypothetical protein MELLADRAFT_113982 [Melampsora larici-populina 98AG31]
MNESNELAGTGTGNEDQTQHRLLASNQLPSSSATDNSTGTLDRCKMWKPEQTLRFHLDVAVCMAFDQIRLAVVLGTDECTIKLWHLKPVLISNPSLSTTVTSVAISTLPPKIQSDSLTVIVWSLPTPEHITYAPFDPTSQLYTFVGHTDGYWDMILLPLKLRDEALLATISENGTIKVWSTDALNSALK